MKIVRLRTHVDDPSALAFWSLRTGALYLCHWHRPWFWRALLRHRR